MKTDYTYLRVRNASIRLVFIPVPTETGGFDLFIEDGEGNNKMLFFKDDTFGDMFEALNTFSIAFGVLGYVVEHKF